MQPQQSLATWNGEIIVGGEPAWFREAASSGLIVRSGDGVGPCLVVQAATCEIIMPGDTLERSADGTIKIATIDSAIKTLREIPAYRRKNKGEERPVSIASQCG